MRAHDSLPARFNVADWCIGRHVGEGRGERAALLTDSGSLSYAALDLGVRRFGGALRSAGVRRGDRIALLLPDGPAFSIAFWGSIAAGAVAVPLNPALGADTLRAVLEDCDPRIVVSDPGLGAPPLPQDSALWSGAEAMAASAAHEPLARYADVHRDAPAFFLYSSGTTGEPKGVVHLQHDIWVACETYAREVLAIGDQDRCFSVAKLFFAYGLGNAQYFPLAVGAQAVLFPGRPTPEAVFDQVQRHRPTLFFGVPTSYAQLLAAMDAGAPADFSSVRLCVSAGEALPAALFERWKERTGTLILDGIGSTEMTHIFVSNRAGEHRPGSTGRVVGGYEVRLQGELGEEVGPGEAGDMLVCGDSSMAYYWNKHEATKATILGDWLRTGDKYVRDSEGFLWHAGRSDDMLKVNGRWVSPVEVEGALIADERVLECAVVGREDDAGLVKGHAFVVLRAGAGSPELEAAILEAVRSRLPAFKVPRWISFVAELPKTATGKIQRFVLRRSAAARG